MSYQVTVPEDKKETVEEVAGLLRDHDVIALAGFRGIPAPQLQTMRARLREIATLKVAKNNLIEIAMDEVAEDRPALADLRDHVHDQTVLIASDEDPFKVFRTLEATKSKAPAKGGETAEEDVVIEEGDTPFQPGPIVGDLQQAGIPAAIQGGKVVINETRVLVEEGDEISRDLAQALTRLDIHPITVGLEFRAALEGDTVFGRDVLDVDIDAFRQDVLAAAGGAFNLAVEISYVTPETAPTLVSKAHGGAIGVAREAGFLTAETARGILAEAHGGAQAIWDRLGPDVRGATAGGAEGDEEE